MNGKGIFYAFFSLLIRTDRSAGGAMKLGAYKREDDDIKDDETLKLVNKLAWPGKIDPNLVDNKKSKDEWYHDLKKYLKMAEKLDFSIGDTKILKDDDREGTLSKAAEVFVKLYKGAKNLLAGRRVRTTLIVFSAIIIGAALGAAVGSVLPIVGTALGATVGAGAVGVIVGLGTAASLGVLGAWGGGWLGKKVARWLFPDEQKDLSQTQRERVQSNTGIEPEMADKMNNYLHERKAAVASELCKDTYEVIRFAGLKRGNAKGMNEIAKFFAHELTTLTEELRKKPEDADLQKEIEGVNEILEALLKAKINDKVEKYTVSPEVRLSIGKAQEKYQAVKTHAVLPVLGAEPDAIPEAVAQAAVEKMENARPQAITPQNKKEKLRTELVGVWEIKKSTYNNNPQGLLDDFRKALKKEIGRKDEKVIIKAGKDPILAVNLMKIAIEEGFTPTLNKESFPDKEARKALREKAYQELKVEPPKKKEDTVSVGMGFKAKK